MAEVTERPDASDDTRERQKIRIRWVYGGFAVGFVVGLIVTGLELAVWGWRILPVQLVQNSVIFPVAGAIRGYRRSPVFRDVPLSWNHLRITTGTLMLLVAYIALLFGMGVSTARIGHFASIYHGKALGSEEMATVFGNIARKEEIKAREKRESVPLLRAGKVPETLLPGQKDFLRSLDTTATPEYRRARYGLIADTEEWVGSIAERNVVVFRGLTEYHEALAARYRRARSRPWLPVAPDPPMPPTK